MSSDPNIKNIQLVGPVTEGGTRKAKARGVRKTFKIDRGEGGGSTSPGTLVQLSASHIPGVAGAPEPVGINSHLTAAGATLQVAGKPKTVEVKSESKADSPVKVILAAPKKKKNLILAAKAAHVPGKTRKVAHMKKVRVTISNLSKKIHRAKAIRKTATDATLDEIKVELHKAGLIKKESKAPEPMLRQMYADFMTLKGRAL